jgi:hypothetical protein
MTSLRQTPEAIVIRRQSAGAARARRRAAYGPIDDHQARAAVRAALEVYIARHGAPAAGALASALAGDCFARAEPKAAARAAAAALFKAPLNKIEGEEV